MFILRIDFKNAQQFSLIFHEADMADNALAAVKDLASNAKGPPSVDLNDDHGHSLTLFKGEIAAIMLIDLVQEMAGVNELAELQRQMRPQPEEGQHGGQMPAYQPDQGGALSPHGFLPGPDVSSVDPRYAHLAARPDIPPFAS